MRFCAQWATSEPGAPGNDIQREHTAHVTGAVVIGSPRGGVGEGFCRVREGRMSESLSFGYLAPDKAPSATVP